MIRPVCHECGGFMDWKARRCETCAAILDQVLAGRALRAELAVEESARNRAAALARRSSREFFVRQQWDEILFEASMILGGFILIVGLVFLLNWWRF